MGDRVVKVTCDPVALLRTRARRQPRLGRPQLSDELLLTRQERGPTGRDTNARDPRHPSEVEVRSQQVTDEQRLGAEQEQDADPRAGSNHHPYRKHAEPEPGQAPSMPARVERHASASEDGERRCGPRAACGQHARRGDRHQASDRAEPELPRVARERARDEERGQQADRGPAELAGERAVPGHEPVGDADTVSAQPSATAGREPARPQSAIPTRS